MSEHPSSGYRVVGGPGPTVADLEELAYTCRLLEDAAARLDTASWTLMRAAQSCDPLSPTGIEARRVLTAVCEGSRSPWRAADRLRELAAALRRTIELYTEAESFAHRALRGGIVAVSSELGERPLLAGILAAAGTVAVAGVAGAVIAGSAVRSAVLRRPDPFLPLLKQGVHRLVEWVPGAFTADDRVELQMLALGSFVRSAAPGRQIPTLRPVPEGAGHLFGLVPPAGPTAVLLRANPPQLPAPRSVAEVLDNVALSYDNGGAPHSLAVPEGVVSVQMLTHPDGTRSWVIEIPGTEDWGLNGCNPLDATTDGRLLAALADDMTDAVLDAMRLSGIGPDEPVMLAGHSLGGMVAMSVAAAVGGAYSVRAVVTAGAPDIPRPVPSGVQVRHYRHDEDVVPQLDGTPNQTSASVTVVTRDLATSGGPAAPTLVEAHAMSRYVETADEAEKELAGIPGMRAFDAAARDVLGPEGTTAVTRQFQVTRDPAVVAAQPPRLWPSS
ncbi:thioesterase domain-containing protein [Cellulomonas terrae]|uniref:Thioesterase domain-containing protein n=1 Tax=Cellulomonas terrae TaxID=311234 RepID=A0A511JKK4_9CELL|nr:thioesterase domain-containing protein [Cellulomonas terrae]GEL98538.1 hypothetical protein CTE05_20850 [Cellulomonas terrae]